MNAKETVARSIVHDILAGAPFRPYPTDPPRRIEDAYAMQDLVTQELIASGYRQSVTGWKIAANSQELLTRFNLGEPASGRVFADQSYRSPAKLPASYFMELAFEPEIAALMCATLDPAEAPFAPDRVLSAIDRYVPALELIDMRKAATQAPAMPDVIAQNITNEGAVLGGAGIAAMDLKDRAVRTTVRIDGTIEQAVTGAAPQNPLEAVTWLANHLAGRGLTLSAGQFVLCGTHTPMRHVTRPCHIEVEMSGLGKVEMQVT